MLGVVLDGAKIAAGLKTAIMTVSVPADRCQLAPGSVWIDPFLLDHGTPVFQVNHFGRHVTEAGTTTQIKCLATNRTYTVHIESIILIDCTLLTDQDLAELGYSSRAEYQADQDDTYQKRRAWFIRFTPVGKSLLQ